MLTVRLLSSVAKSLNLDKKVTPIECKSCAKEVAAVQASHQGYSLLSGMSSNVDEGEKIITVYNVPYDVTAEQLMLHFMHRRNGGRGDVEHIEIHRNEHLQNETADANGRKTISAVAKIKFSSSKSETSI